MIFLFALFISAAHSATDDCEAMLDYVTIESGRAPVKAWIRGVPMDDESRRQLENIARLPFIHSHIAVMPDVHFGRGATVGSVIATKGAIVPAAVGVDIGCGMMAVETSLTARDLPANLAELRAAIEAAVPHGGVGAKGGWQGHIPSLVSTRWRTSKLDVRLAAILRKIPQASSRYALTHFGTLGGGNHFIEINLDEAGHVWVMLHTGSRGIGNSIGQYFIERAREMLSFREAGRHLANRQLAWFEDGEAEFSDYLEAVTWAQDYAHANREIIMERVLMVLRKEVGKFKLGGMNINSHHNYVAREHHFGADVLVTRKGAASARLGQLGIIPGSMGARSFIVRGKGNEESFHSSSHGAGRILSRGEARQQFTLEDHWEATKDVECRKDPGILDETPGAYKDIDAVMAAQENLVEVVHTLKQVLCVKGG